MEEAREVAWVVPAPLRPCPSCAGSSWRTRDRCRSSEQDEPEIERELNSMEAVVKQSFQRRSNSFEMFFSDEEKKKTRPFTCQSLRIFIFQAMRNEPFSLHEIISRTVNHFWHLCFFCISQRYFKAGKEKEKIKDTSKKKVNSFTCLRERNTKKCCFLFHVKHMSATEKKAFCLTQIEMKFFSFFLFSRHFSFGCEPIRLHILCPPSLFFSTKRSDWVQGKR